MRALVLTAAEKVCNDVKIPPVVLWSTLEIDVLRAKVREVIRWLEAEGWKLVVT